MARIILEDMKINKSKVQTPFKKEASIHHEFRPREMENIYRTQERTERVVDEPEIPRSNEKIERKKLDIQKYFKNKFSRKHRIPRTPEEIKQPRIISKTTRNVLIMTLIFCGIYWGANYFQKTIITISAKHQGITYSNKEFIASKDEKTKGVDFEIMIVSDKKIKNIVLTEPKEVSIKAEGVITLYNEFSTKPEKISAGSFVSDKDGKAYKTTSMVMIPGLKTINNKIIPGQAEVMITAFLPGEAYNGSPTDFYLNAFKGTTKYNKIYGKLKHPITGGATGLVYTLDEKSKGIIDNIAQTSVKNDLLKQVKALVPPGYILYPNAMTYSYKAVDNLISKTPEAEIPIDGVLSVIIFNEKSLLDNIIQASLPGIKGDELKEIRISDYDKLSFGFANKDELISKESISIPFFLTGNMDIKWYPNIEILKTKLMGIAKKDVLSIFRQDPGISSAIVKIFPPWQKFLSDDISNIDIIIK